MGPFRNLGAAAYFYRASNAVVAGTSEIDGASIDMRAAFGAPFEGITFIAALGTVTDTSVTLLKVQGSADGSTNWTDLAGTHQTCNTTGDSNKLLIVDCFRPQFRYVRPVMTRATANAVVDGIIGLAYLAHSMPVTTQDTTVSVPAAGGSGSQGAAVGVPVNIVAYPASGTA